MVPTKRSLRRRDGGLKRDPVEAALPEGPIAPLQELLESDCREVLTDCFDPKSLMRFGFVSKAVRKEAWR
jgi:hypothetical protein